MGLDWRDPKTIAAVETYVRLAVGAACVVVLIYAFVDQKIDAVALMKALLALIGIDRAAIGGIGLIRAHNGRST